MLNHLEAVAQQITVCPRCEAGPGVPCRSVTGLPARRMHEPRIRPLRQARTAGYRQGAGDVLDFLRRRNNIDEDTLVVARRIYA